MSYVLGASVRHSRYSAPTATANRYFLRLNYINITYKITGKLETTRYLYPLAAADTARSMILSSCTKVGTIAARLQYTRHAAGYQFPSAPRIRRTHTRVACTRNLVSIARLMVGLKMQRNRRGSSGVEVSAGSSKDRNSHPSTCHRQMVSPACTVRLLMQDSGKELL